MVGEAKQGMYEGVCLGYIWSCLLFLCTWMLCIYTHACTHTPYTHLQYNVGFVPSQLDLNVQFLGLDNQGFHISFKFIGLGEQYMNILETLNHPINAVGRMVVSPFTSRMFHYPIHNQESCYLATRTFTTVSLLHAHSLWRASSSLRLWWHWLRGPYNSGCWQPAMRTLLEWVCVRFSLWFWGCTQGPMSRSVPNLSVSLMSLVQTKLTRPWNQVFCLLVAKNVTMLTVKSF